MDKLRATFILAHACLLSCCAAFDPAHQALVTVRVGSGSQERAVRFVRVHAGQVLVEGNWTVIFKVDERDVPWIQEVARHEEAARLVWDDRVVWQFHPATDGLGYFNDFGFHDEATARRVAEEIRRVQGPPAVPAAQQDAADEASQRSGSTKEHRADG